MFPPNEAMSGPPPGTSPQGLASMGPGLLESQGTDGLDGAKPAGGGAGGLKDVFDEVQSVLDALAEILPEQAVELDDIKTRLAEVLGKAISGGATFRGNEGSGAESPAKPTFPA